MGSKTAAREAARRRRRAGRAGHRRRRSPATLPDDDDRGASRRPIGYPLLVKAVAGGGGKGMRIVRDAAELPGAIRAARSEAGVGVRRRRRVPRAAARSAAPHRGAAARRSRTAPCVPFVERECSIQRRHQKVVEESPSPAVTPALRRRMTAAAAAVARAVGYTNAGTIEFLLDGDGRFYFLEMNTRLQVEHPVTEMVTGDRPRAVADSHRARRAPRRSIRAAMLDAARARDRVPHLRRGSGSRLHAVARAHPTRCAAPSGPASATTAASTAGFEVPIYYDSMISKLVAWGADRPTGHRAHAPRARRVRRRRHQDDDPVLPVAARRSRTFIDAQIDTTLLDRELAAVRAGRSSSRRAPRRRGARRGRRLVLQAAPRAPTTAASAARARWRGGAARGVARCGE